VKVSVGEKFGRLTLLRRAPEAYKSQTSWLCRCSCGTEKVVGVGHLRTGSTVSCGCYAREQASKRQSTHGLTKNIAYRPWIQMRTRCANPKATSYEYYGDRGIQVCQRWDDFTLFLQDMGERPSLLYSLDRIDTNGHYEPGNCEWKTHKDQMRNRRNTVRLTFAGETLPVSQWAERIGKPNRTLLQRIKYGWSPAQVLEIEPR